MSIAAWGEGSVVAQGRVEDRRGRRMRRALLLAALLAGAGWAAQATGPADAAAASRAGAELTRLLRFMALVKGGMALGVAALVWWRLALPASPVRLAALTAAAGAMAAGPVLIWSMAHVGLGALLLHGSLVGALAALWGDPAVVTWLGERAARRERRRTSTLLPATGGMDPEARPHGIRQRGGARGKARTSPV